jgi:hypothetical protein
VPESFEAGRSSCRLCAIESANLEQYMMHVGKTAFNSAIARTFRSGGFFRVN